MADYDFEQSIGYWLTTSSQAFQRALSERLAGEGVTHRQTHVIGWLKLAGQLTQGELAKRMMIEPPTLVRLLDRMETSGWIERLEDTVDRRRRYIRLTEQVEPVWERIAENARELRRDAVIGLSEEDVATLLRLLQKVQENLTNLTEHQESVDRLATQKSASQEMSGTGTPISLTPG